MRCARLFSNTHLVAALHHAPLCNPLAPIAAVVCEALGATAWRRMCACDHLRSYKRIVERIVERRRLYEIPPPDHCTAACSLYRHLVARRRYDEAQGRTCKRSRSRVSLRNEHAFHACRTEEGKYALVLCGPSRRALPHRPHTGPTRLLGPRRASWHPRGNLLAVVSTFIEKPGGHDEHCQRISRQRPSARPRPRVYAQNAPSLPRTGGYDLRSWSITASHFERVMLGFEATAWRRLSCNFAQRFVQLLSFSSTQQQFRLVLSVVPCFESLMIPFIN
eukprot:IDg11029t1